MAWSTVDIARAIIPKPSAFNVAAWLASALRKTMTISTR
jgi:hypothetical protein